MSRPNEKTNYQQYELLVTLMQEKPDIAQNYTKRSPEAVAAFWDDLTGQLNQLGTRRRDASGWKKVWSDYKGYIKKKLAANKREILGTGGGPYKQKSFTPLEEAVLALVNINHGVDGIGALSFGTDNEQEATREPSSSSATVAANGAENNGQAENLEVIPNTANTSTKRPRKALSSIQLLRKQVDNQEAFFGDIKKALQDTANILKDTTKTLQDSAVYLKRVYRSEESICEVERKKLKEMQGHNAEMQRIALQKLNIKARILELEISKTKLLLEE